MIIISGNPYNQMNLSLQFSKVPEMSSKAFFCRVRPVMTAALV